MIYAFCHLLFLMLAGHALADRPLQGDEISRGKNRALNPGGLWLQYLAVHGLIHGGAVALVTGLWWLGAAEAVAHAPRPWGGWAATRAARTCWTKGFTSRARSRGRLSRWE